MATWDSTLVTPSFTGQYYTANVLREKDTRPGEPIFAGTDTDGTVMYTLAYITDKTGGYTPQIDIWRLPVIFTGGATKTITLKVTLDGTQKTKNKPIVRDGAGGGGRGRTPKPH